MKGCQNSSKPAREEEEQSIVSAVHPAVHSFIHLSFDSNTWTETLDVQQQMKNHRIITYHGESLRHIENCDLSNFILLLLLLSIQLCFLLDDNWSTIIQLEQLLLPLDSHPAACQSIANGVLLWMDWRAPNSIYAKLP